MSVQDGCQSGYSLTIKVYRTRLCFPSAGLFDGLRAYRRPSGRRVMHLSSRHDKSSDLMWLPSSQANTAYHTHRAIYIARQFPADAWASGRSSRSNFSFYCLSDLRSSAYAERPRLATICQTLYGVQVFRFVSCSRAMEDMSM